MRAATHTLASRYLTCGAEWGARPASGHIVARSPATTMHRHAHEAALLLWTCRQSGTVIDALPDSLRPRDPLTGHAIQAALPDVANRPVVGWKIAATSA